MNKNTLLNIIGIAIAIIGIIIFLFGSKIIGIIIGAIGIILVFSVNLIKASKSETDGSTNEDVALENQINNALTQSRQDKYKAESEIRRLKQWACDSIFTTYSDLFPQGTLTYQRDSLLDKYPEIKTQYSEKISFEMMDKCDNLVKGCINQISLEESKIKVFEKLMDEYTDLKQKVRIAKQNEQKNKRLGQVENKLKESQENVSGVASAIHHNYTLTDLSKEVALKQEYVKQLEQLQYQYGSEANANEAISFKAEVDNILNKLNHE